jgi:MFS family permease
MGDRMRRAGASARPHQPGINGPSYSLVVMCAALVLVTLSEGMLLSVVPSAVAGIGRLLQVSPGSLNWVITVQLLATGVCTPVFSRLGDIRGHRQILRAAVVTVAIGGVLIAIAPSFGVLLVGRALQGPGGAFTPLAVGILREHADTRRLRQGTVAVVTGATAGVALGFLAAAQVFQATDSVRDVLWIPATCSVAAAAAAVAFLPESRWRSRLRMDWLGVLSLSGGLGILLLALANGAGWGWASGRTVSTLLGGAVLLGIWAVVELLVTDPLIDLRAMSRRAVAPLFLAGLPIGVAFFGSATATNTFLAASKEAVGYGFDLDVTAVAYIGLANAAAAILGAVVVPRLIRYLGHIPTVCIGCFVMLVGYAGLAVWHGVLWAVVAANSVSGLGIGLVAGAMTVVLTERSGPATTSVAIGTWITVRAIGGTMAGAGFAALLTQVTIAGTAIPRESAYAMVWLTCAIASLLSLLVAAMATRAAR